MMRNYIILNKFHFQYNFNSTIEIIIEIIILIVQNQRSLSK